MVLEEVVLSYFFFVFGSCFKWCIYVFLKLCEIRKAYNMSSKWSDGGYKFWDMSHF